LNYPKMSDVEREEALKEEEPVQQKRGKPNQKTGLIGVYTAGKTYQSLVYSTQKNKLVLPTIDSSLTKAPKKSSSH
jgi:hypothetical protein